MHTLEEKQIAKEILIAMIEKDCLKQNEYPDSYTVTDMVCSAYKNILKTISEF